MKPEELRAFVDLVKRMRVAQKNYFSGREAADLNASRDLERRVDKAVENYFNPPGPGLFDPK